MAIPTKDSFLLDQIRRHVQCDNNRSRNWRCLLAKYVREMLVVFGFVNQAVFARQRRLNPATTYEKLDNSFGPLMFRFVSKRH
jgi:hypothetical protein